MYAILLGLDTFLILLNLVGLSLLAKRYLHDYLIAKAAGVLALCLVLFFIEHFIGLGKLTWLWPLTSAASLYLIYRQRGQLKNLWKSEGVFLLGFGYCLLWRGVFPDIYPTSERVTDMYFISNYLPGATLPPLDNWLPTHRFDFYYSFQHYSAALMGRLFGLDAGTAYNFAYCILFGLAIAAAWSFISRVCGKPLHRWLVMLAFVIGGTGVSPMIHFLIDEQKTGRPTDLWASMRFVGNYDQTLNTPLAQTLFPKQTNQPNFEPRDLPAETFSYQPYVGDYHPPLGSFFLLMLALALIAALEKERTNRLYQGLLALTVPAVMITNTWLLPLQALLVAAWAAYRHSMQSPPDWRALLAGGALGFALIFPYLTHFAQQASASPIRWTEWQDHTPLAQFIALQWPLILVTALGLTQARTRRLTLFFALTVGLALLISEMIYVDDPSGGKFVRTNTTMKWWGWIYALGVVALGALNLAAKQKAVRYATIATLLLLCTYGFDLARDWYYGGKSSAGKMHGQQWLIKDDTQRDMIQYLRTQPHGIVLESIERAYSNSTTIALFSGKPALQGWVEHIVTWRGPSTHARLQQEQAKRFYAGQKDDALGWLQQNKVRYIVWNAAESANVEAFKNIQQQIGSQYYWKSFFENGATRIGVWIKQ
jgi:uncharacterized membrane protein